MTTVLRKRNVRWKDLSRCYAARAVAVPEPEPGKTLETTFVARLTFISVSQGFSSSSSSSFSLPHFSFTCYHEISLRAPPQENPFFPPSYSASTCPLKTFPLPWADSPSKERSDDHMVPNRQEHQVGQPQFQNHHRRDCSNVYDDNCSCLQVGLPSSQSGWHAVQDHLSLSTHSPSSDIHSQAHPSYPLDHNQRTSNSTNSQVMSPSTTSSSLQRQPHNNNAICPHTYSHSWISSTLQSQSRYQNEFRNGNFPSRFGGVTRNPLTLGDLQVLSKPSLSFSNSIGQHNEESEQSYPPSSVSDLSSAAGTPYLGGSFDLRPSSLPSPEQSLGIPLWDDAQLHHQTNHNRTQSLSSNLANASLISNSPSSPSTSLNGIYQPSCQDRVLTWSAHTSTSSHPYSNDSFKEAPSHLARPLVPSGLAAALPDGGSRYRDDNSLTSRTQSNSRLTAQPTQSSAPYGFQNSQPAYFGRGQEHDESQRGAPAMVRKAFDN